MPAVCTSSSGRRDLSAFDDALAESFFASLETELIDRGRWRTHTEARPVVIDSIETFYHPRCQYSALGYLSPAEYERRARLTAASSPTLHEIGAAPRAASTWRPILTRSAAPS